jgi:hypothetical protein
LPVELVMQVTRGNGDRLTGTVRTETDAAVHEFSGTLELMRVFEELVPIGLATGTADSREERASQ